MQLVADLLGYPAAITRCGICGSPPGSCHPRMRPPIWSSIALLWLVQLRENVGDGLLKIHHVAGYLHGSPASLNFDCGAAGTYDLDEQLPNDASTSSGSKGNHDLGDSPNSASVYRCVRKRTGR